MDKLESLEQELSELKSKTDEYLNGWKRSKADFINREKEIEKEREAIIKYANHNFAMTLLPFVDSFHASLASMPPDLIQSEWVKGFMQLGNHLEETLRSVGVQPIDSATSQFNPEIHECVGTEKHDEAGKILREVQKGYLLNGKVLRPAKVIVSEA